MAQRIHSFRFLRKVLERNPARKRGHLALIGVLLVVLAVFVVLQTLKFAGMFNVSQEQGGRLYGVSAEAVAYVPRGEVAFSLAKEERGSAVAQSGDQNVPFLSFHLDSRKAAKVDGLVLSLTGAADDEDLESIQLYIDGEFFAERAFVDGKADFRNVRVRVHPGNAVHFEVKGSLSHDALPGHRLKVGFAKEEDFSVKSIVSEPLLGDVDFPFWGSAVSVIGNRL